MNRTTCLIAAALCLAAWAIWVGNGSAVAQAGSTGGTVGKTNKSVSGGGELTTPVPRHSSPELKRPRASQRGGKERTFKNPTVNRRSSPTFKTFLNPTIAGLRVDRCLHYASECDEPAAAAWCRSKGFARATDWKWESVPETIGQSDGHRCSIGCGGFSIVVCK